MNWGSHFVTTKGNTVQKNANTNVNHEPPVPMMPVRRARPLSEAAAAAAEHVNNLEADLEDARTRLGEAVNRIHLLEERCKMLEGDRKVMEHERDYHKRAHTLIEAALRNSATILLDCLREPQPVPANTQQVDAAVAEVEKALSTDSALSEAIRAGEDERRE